MAVRLAVSAVSIDMIACNNLNTLILNRCGLHVDDRKCLNVFHSSYL
jgi:hypothetical protein